MSMSISVKWYWHDWFFGLMFSYSEEFIAVGLGPVSVYIERSTR